MSHNFSSANVHLTAIIIVLSAILVDADWNRSTRTELFHHPRKCSHHAALTCYLQPTTGSNVTGVVRLREVSMNRSHRRFWARKRCGVLVTANVHNLTPGLHGFHIHTYGDIRAPDGTSTGGHFANPRGKEAVHRYPESPERHWGDFGNLAANASGIALFSRVDEVVDLQEVIGRSFVIHAAEDKGPSEQPSGASGSRQASCVIGYVNPEL